MRKTILILILSFFSSLSIAEEINLSCVSDKDQATYIITIQPFDEIAFTYYRTKDNNLPTDQLTVAGLKASHSHYNLKFYGSIFIGDPSNYTSSKKNTYFEINRSNLNFSISREIDPLPSQVEKGQCKVFVVNRPNNVI